MINVLIVDDMQSSRMVLQMILEENFEEITIFEASSGVEGLELIASEQINIILSDIEMPEMNGFEFAKVLKNSPKTKNIPLIFISSHSLEEYVQNTESTWGFDILQKPVIKGILIAKITNYINMQKIIEKKSTLIDENIIYSETDKKGIITSVSKAFINISGYSKEELIGQSHNIVRHPSMKAKTFEEMWKTIQQGKTWEGIITNLKKSQDEAYILKATVFPIYSGEKITGYGSARQDITQQIESVEQFEKILNAQLSIVVITKGKELVHVNNILFDEFNFKNMEDFKNQHDCICELFIEKQAAHLMPQMGSLNWIEYIQENSDKINEAYMIDSEGNEKVYHVSHRGYLQEDEHIIIFDDITEIKHQNAILFKQSRFAEMGEMIGMIAHQWRQPLSAMNALMIKLNMKRRLGDLSDEDWKESYAKHNELTSYMTTTIDDFKNFFKSNSETVEIEINEIVSKPYRLVEGLLNKQNVEFNIVYEDENTASQKVKISSAKLDQVFLNLYKNALDEFIAKDKRDGKITVTCKKLPKAVIFHVCDNAGGIPDAVLEKVFDAYFSTKADNGTGIGLYMTKMIVEQHAKGEIEAYNIGEGACFQVSIPIEISDINKGL